jgi:predicted CopG family antitoxin
MMKDIRKKTFFVPEKELENFERFKEKCKDEGRSYSEVIRELIKQYLTKK